MTPRQLSNELGIDYKRLCRWMARGIARPTGKTAGDLEKLRKRLGFGAVKDLWGREKRFWEKAMELFGDVHPNKLIRQMYDTRKMLGEVEQAEPVLWERFTAGEPFQRTFWYSLGEFRNGIPLEEIKVGLLAYLSKTYGDDQQKGPID
jgi:hypothetical protein